MELPGYLFLPPVGLTSENTCTGKRFRIDRVLMFPVAASIIKSVLCFLPHMYRKIHCLTSEFHGTFYTKNRYRMNHEAMSTISVFRLKFTLEFTSLAMNFS